MRGVEPLSASPFPATSTCLVISFKISTFLAPSDRFQDHPALISPLWVKATPKVVPCINSVSS